MDTAERPKGRRARLLKVGALALVLLGALQWGGQFLLNRWATRTLGPQAATFHLQLWALRIGSASGSGQIEGIPFAWEGVRLSLLRGRADVARLSFGEGPVPLAEARGVEVSELFRRPVVRVKTLSVETAASGWAELVAQIEKAKSEANPKRGGAPAFALWVETLSLLSPFGKPAGSLSLSSDGGAMWFCGDLRGEEWGHLHGEGLLSPAGGDIVIDGGVRARPFRLQAHALGENWVLEGAIGEGTTAWIVDGLVRKATGAEILLQQLGDGRPSPWVLLGWSEAAGERPLIPSLEMAREGFPLASLGLPLPDFLKSAKFAAHTSRTDNQNKAERECVSLEVRGGTLGSGEGGTSQTIANLNWTASSGTSMLFALQLPLPGSASVPFLPSEVRLGGVLDSLSGPKTTLDAAFEGPSSHLQIHGEGSRSQGAGVFFGHHNEMALDGNILWSSSGLKGELRCRGRLPGGSDWPLPEGLWTSSLDFVAPRTAPLQADLSARGEGGAIAEAHLVGGALRVTARRLSLSARWGRLEGVDLEASAESVGTAGMPVNTRLEGHALALAAGEIALRDLVVSGRQEEARLRLDARAVLPSLEGWAETRWEVPLAAPDRGEMTDGRASLLGGQIEATGLRVDHFLSAPGRWFGWSARGASIAREPLSDLRGECGPAPDGSPVAGGSGKGLGGTVTFSVHPSAGERALKVGATGLEAPAVAAFLRRFQELPFGLAEGKVAAEVEAPLTAFGPGWRATVHPSAVTLLVPDERHQFRKVDGTLRVEALATGVRVRSEVLTLEGGKVPVQLEGEVGTPTGALRFAIPVLPGQEVQNALFDFLPEFVGYGQVRGGLGLEGHLVPSGQSTGFQVKARFEEGAFSSEDKSLVLEGLQGTLALAVSIGGGGPSLPGFRPPDRGSVGAVMGDLSTPLPGGETLTIQGITFSVYGLSQVRLSSQAGSDGITRLRLVEGTLWDGPARAEVGLSIGSADIRYAGQVVMDHASLREFCRQSEGLTGFLGGRFSGSLTFRGDRLGLGALKALADLSVDPAGDEPLVLGRDFLVKVGGAPMKKLVTRRFQEYDRASLKVGIRSGALTVQDLVLSHEANPFKALMRKDLSFELRVPMNNSISLYNLLDLIKGIGERSATVETP